VPTVHRDASGTALQRSAPSLAIPSHLDWELVRRPLGQSGRPLDAATADRMGQRFAHDFSHVRVHDDAVAAASSRAVDAEAFTVGHHVVFAHGRYSPGTGPGDRLLAHELTHVVQQAGQRIGSGPLPVVPHGAPSEREARSGRTAHAAMPPGGTRLQRSPLSDSVRATWTAGPTIEALLARLTRPDIRGVADPDVDAEIARILGSRPDDLWVAQRIREGRLGQSVAQAGITATSPPPAPRPVTAFFVRGRTATRALVIAGVHGSEEQGIEVAERLLADLATNQPHLSVIIVPSLFPHAAAARTREGATPTNRNFPTPNRALAAATPAGGSGPVDAEARAILPENVMLMQLIERFAPDRIISIHGTHRPGAAGISFDPRQLRGDELAGALATAGMRAVLPDFLGGQRLPGEDLATATSRHFRDERAQRMAAAKAEDRGLASRAAVSIDTATAGVAGRERRGFTRERERPTRADLQRRRAHPSVAGNVGSSGALNDFVWSGQPNQPGVSLGGYAPARGISVFTVEPPVNARSSRYPGEEAGRVTQAGRRVELQAYTDAVRTVLLGQ
jgi:hypothetical protein